MEMGSTTKELNFFLRLFLVLSLYSLFPVHGDVQGGKGMAAGGFRLESDRPHDQKGRKLKNVFLNNLHP